MGVRGSPHFHGRLQKGKKLLIPPSKSTLHPGIVEPLSVVKPITVIPPF